MALAYFLKLYSLEKKIRINYFFGGMNEDKKIEIASPHTKKLYGNLDLFVVLLVRPLTDL